jgi:hypothetical protein
MKPFLLFTSILLFFAASPQNKKAKTYLSGTFGWERSSERQTGYSAKASLLLDIEHTAYVGAGVGISKRDELGGYVFPVFLNINLMPPVGKLIPVVLFQPGYGIYNKTIRIGQSYAKYSGGFCFYGGGGVGLRMRQSILQIMGGYFRYNFGAYDISSTIDGLGIALTILSY